MQLVYPDAGLVELLFRQAAEGFHFHLFVNFPDVNQDSLLEDFEEAAWASYSSILVELADFTLDGVVEHRGKIVADVISFENLSGATQEATGLFVTDVTDTILLQACYFDDAPWSRDNLESWDVVPVFSNFSEFIS